MALVYLFTNNAVGRLREPVNAGDGSILLRIGHGSYFPDPDTEKDQAFLITVQEQLGDDSLEIMECYQRDGDTLYVHRAQDGTSALSFPEDGRLGLRLPRKALQNFVQEPPADDRPYLRLRGEWKPFPYALLPSWGEMYAQIPLQQFNADNTVYGTMTALIPLQTVAITGDAPSTDTRLAGSMLNEAMLNG